MMQGEKRCSCAFVKQEHSCIPGFTGMQECSCFRNAVPPSSLYHFKSVLSSLLIITMWFLGAVVH